MTTPIYIDDMPHEIDQDDIRGPGISQTKAVETSKTTLINTTVKGDPEKIAALKLMGHGMISYAFRVGYDIVLGTYTEELEQLQREKKELESQRDITNGKLSFIDSKIEKLQDLKAQQALADYSDKELFERAVGEYVRCAPLIIFKNMPMIPKHLADLMDWTSPRDVKEFFSGRDLEPTEEEIKTFLEMKR